MCEFRYAFFCAGTNFRKWYKNPTIAMLTVLWAVFLVRFLFGTSLFCVKSGYRITPWVLPFCLNNTYTLLIFSIMVLILFSQAPFCDTTVPFTMVRTGKQWWFVGQMLYIIGASFAFTVFTAGCIFLIFAPCMSYDAGWGGVIVGLAEQPSLIAEYSTFFAVNPAILRHYTPWKATLYTFLLQWLSCVMIGFVILCLNTVVRPGIGVIVSAAIAFWCPFAKLQQYNYGSWVFYTMLFQWSSLDMMAPIQARGPSITLAVSVELLCIVMMAVISTIVFCRRDTIFETHKF